ncbi:MAG: NAD(P)-dependent oxidoreductase [Arenicellales bacterium]|nr:NAD(P)-dependent oxidoreductase [Arenicellales bacterium]
MSQFRVALSGDFKKSDGAPSFPEFDLSPLENDQSVDLFYLENENVISANQLVDVDALILLSNRVAEESFPPPGRLSVIARFGVGYDNVDVPACTANDCALVITPDGVRRSVAVSILTLLFALTGKLMVKDRIARLGPDGWAKKTLYNGIGLVGRTLGSVGIGNIGAELFRMAQPFDMKFVAHDPYANTELANRLGVELVELDDVFRRSDFICINCPLNESTHHLINSERLALMKPEAYLINTARGPIVDQAALTQALQEERIAGAGLDVLEQEPPDADDPILKLNNAIITPHALCWTDQIFEGNGHADVVAVQKIMQGQVPTGIVNRDIEKSEKWHSRLASYRKLFG